MKKVNPLTQFRKGNEVRIKKVLNSYPKYGLGGSGPINPGKEMFDKIQQYANNASLYEKLSPHGLKELYKKPVKRREMSQDKLDQIIEVNKMGLPWDKFKRSVR